MSAQIQLSAVNRRAPESTHDFQYVILVAKR